MHPREIQKLVDTIVSNLDYLSKNGVEVNTKSYDVRMYRKKLADGCPFDEHDELLLNQEAALSGYIVKKYNKYRDLGITYGRSLDIKKICSNAVFK